MRCKTTVFFISLCLSYIKPYFRNYNSENTHSFFEMYKILSTSNITLFKIYRGNIEKISSNKLCFNGLTETFYSSTSNSFTNARFLADTIINNKLRYICHAPIHIHSYKLIHCQIYTPSIVFLY